MKGLLIYNKNVKNARVYSRMDPLLEYHQLGRNEMENVTHLEPEIKRTLIQVAGNWAMELQKSNSNLTANDLVQSFRDVYSSLLMMFLIPEK